MLNNYLRRTNGLTQNVVDGNNVLFNGLGESYNIVSTPPQIIYDENTGIFTINTIGVYGVAWNVSILPDIASTYIGLYFQQITPTSVYQGGTTTPVQVADGLTISGNSIFVNSIVGATYALVVASDLSATITTSSFIKSESGSIIIYQMQ